MALGYKVNAFEDEAGEQPLHSAVIHGRPAIARALISAGADLAGRRAGGHTPLHCAAYQGSEEITKLLLDAGADPTAHNDEDDTPYDSAIKHGHTGVADLLARHGETANGEDLAAWRRQRSPLDDPFEEKSLVEAQDRYASRTISEALKNGDPNYEVPRIRELPEDLMCPIMCEIMKDPVLLMEDGHTYERVALEQWFATGARTSPSTSAELDSLATAPNHTVKKLIAALLEEHRGRAAD